MPKRYKNNKKRYKNNKGQEISVEIIPTDDTPQKAIPDEHKTRCQWVTIDGVQCTRHAQYSCELIKNGKLNVRFLQFISSPSTMQSCCNVCSQHLKVALGLSMVGIGKMLVMNKLLGQTEQDIYAGSMLVTFGKDFNPFKQIFEHMKTSNNFE